MIVSADQSLLPASRPPTLETPDGGTESSTCGAASCRRRSRFALLTSTPSARASASTSSRAQYLGDPEQFWRICDANGAMRPEELTEERRAAGAHHAAGRYPGSPAMLKGVSLDAADRARSCRCPCRRSVLEALTERAGHDRGRGGAAGSSSRSHCKNFASHTTFLPAGFFDRADAGDPRRHVNGMPNVLMDGVITQPAGDLRVTSRAVDADGHRARTCRVDGPDRARRDSVSGDAAEASRSRSCSRSTRCSASFRWSSRSDLDRHADPDGDAFPHTQGRISHYITRARRRRRLRLLRRPGPRCRA